MPATDVPFCQILNRLGIVGGKYEQVSDYMQSPFLNNALNDLSRNPGPALDCLECPLDMFAVMRKIIMRQDVLILYSVSHNESIEVEISVLYPSLQQYAM